MGKRRGKRKGKYSAHRGRSNFERWLPNEWRNGKKKFFLLGCIKGKMEEGRAASTLFAPPFHEIFLRLRYHHFWQVSLKFP